MRITFLLPAYAISPIGGYKIVYEYANRLTKRGHEVAIVYPRRCRPRVNIREYLKILLWYFGRWFEPHGPRWFRLEPGVRSVFVADASSAGLPDSDALVATGWATATPVSAADSSKGSKYYLIQDLELWDGPEESVLSTWTLPLNKIVVASWLLDVAASLGEAERTKLILNSVDLAEFGITVPIADRPLPVVGMLYHRRPTKGSELGIRALRELKKDIPLLGATLFGVPARPPGLPSWIRYVRLPTRTQLRDLYNSCQVFIQTSLREGWGLTATESMACGCALVTTQNGGSRDYAIDGRTARVVESPTPRSIATAVRRLLEDDAERVRLAEAGYQLVMSLSWDRAVDSFEGHLTKASGGVGRAT